MTVNTAIERTMMSDSILVGFFGAGAAFNRRSLPKTRPETDIKTRIDEYNMHKLEQRSKNHE